MTSEERIDEVSPVVEAGAEKEENAVGETLDVSEAENLEEVEVLKEALEQSRSEVEEYLDGWRRSQAEFSNYKKRQRAEQAKMRDLANASLLRKLLPVLDDLARAIITLPDGLEKLSWSQGLLMVERKLQAVLESEGVEPIDTRGETFDPHYHEAVTHEEAPGFGEGEIIGEVQGGYVLGDRVLRPALVRVAKASESTSGEEVATEEEKD